MSVARVRVALIGAGGLARAMAGALSAAGGFDVTVGARRPARAAAVARGRARVRAVAPMADALAGAAIVVVAVPDAAIATVARSLAATRRSWRGVVVLHAAGSLGTRPLALFARRGAATGVLHPLAVLAARGTAALRGAAARIEGAPRARAAASRLARAAGLVPLRASGLSTPSGRIAYHAAASLASNDLVGLLVAAGDLLRSLGVPPRAAERAVSRLAQGALDQALAAGRRGAFTGPVARGDAATLESQLRALSARDPEAAAAHRALSARLLRFARKGGRLSARQSARLSEVIGRGRGRLRAV